MNSTALILIGLAAVAGGVIGGRLAKRVPAVMLRRIIVTIGVIVALIYLVNQFGFQIISLGPASTALSNS